MKIFEIIIVMNYMHCLLNVNDALLRKSRHCMVLSIKPMSEMKMVPIVGIWYFYDF